MITRNNYIFHLCIVVFAHGSMFAAASDIVIDDFLVVYKSKYHINGNNGEIEARKGINNKIKCTIRFSFDIDQNDLFQTASRVFDKLDEHDKKHDNLGKFTINFLGTSDRINELILNHFSPLMRNEQWLTPKTDRNFIDSQLEKAFSKNKEYQLFIKNCKVKGYKIHIKSDEMKIAKDSDGGMTIFGPIFGVEITKI